MAKKGTQWSHLAPGTYFQELDFSQTIALAVSTIGAVVLESKRGPIGPRFHTTWEDWRSYYGPQDPTVSFVHDSVRAFFREASMLWSNRVVNGALHGGAVCFKDTSSGVVVGTPALDNRHLWHPFTIGDVAGFAGGSRPMVTLEFSGAIVTGNTFNMNITDGITVEAVEATSFTTNHNTTMTAIADAISTAMAEFGTGGIVQVHQEVDTVANPNNFIIKIFPPTTVSLSFASAALTGGASQRTIYINTAPKIMTVFQENPGEWGENLAVRLTNNDVGLRQRFRLTFSGAINSNGSPKVVINGRTVQASYDTDSDTTMAAFATAIAADVDILSATVTQVPGATNNDRSITIVAKYASPSAVAITAASVTGGTGQKPNILIQETLKGIAPTGEFDLEVFERPNLVYPVERFRCTLKSYVNGRGEQTFAEKRINTDGLGSKLIRVIVDPAAANYSFLSTLTNNVEVIDNTAIYLKGGDDGDKVLNTQLATAWGDYANRAKYPMRLLINGGYTDISVQQAMIALADARSDCFAILDMPSSMQAVQSAYNYRMQELNIDSSYGAIYTPDLKIIDNDSDDLRFVPPSGYVAAAYAYSDKVAAVYFAPAGLERGGINQIRGVRVHYNEDGDLELLDSANINVILLKNARYVIWGADTLQRKRSILSSVPARRLLNAIKTGYADALDYSVFNPHNQWLRFRAKSIGDRILQPLKDAGALYFFHVQCDEKNNPPAVVDQDLMIVDVYLQITRMAKRILLRTILQRTGASFQETAVFVNNANAAASA